MIIPKIEILPKIEPIKNTFKSLREKLLYLLSVSATLSGLCITAVALMHTLGKDKMDITIVDDMFPICSLLFLFCIYLIFFSLRIKPIALVIKLSKFVEALFFILDNDDDTGCFFDGLHRLVDARLTRFILTASYARASLVS